MTLFSTDRILVPIDFSDSAFNAQAEALKLVAHPSHLHILHVLPHLNPGDLGVMWETVDDHSRKQHIERAFRDRFPNPPHSQTNFSVMIGDASSEIIDYAKLHTITLIIIPSHGRTGVSRFVIGSVAERVVRLAPCPVLVLRR